MNRQRLFQCMENEGIDYLVLDSFENVSYVSGMEVPVPTGAVFDFGGGMPLAYALVSLADRKVTLICTDFFAEGAENSSADRIWYFRHFHHFRNVDGAEELRKILPELLPGKKTDCVIAVERLSCPAFVCSLLDGYRIADAGPILRYARKIKTPEELTRIRRSAEIEDCGQNRLIEYARNFKGESDFEMWSGITRSMNEAAGMAVGILGELSLGRNVEIRSGSGGPSGIKGAKGDMCRMDISIRHHGYWCDCTNTVTMGRKPDEKQMRYFRIVHEAYEAAREQLYPGKRLSDAVEAEARVYQKYGMEQLVYTGHQIGCGVNEPRRLVCYEHDMIEPGMVVCIEPQQYGADGENIAVRLERVIAITENGPEELNRFPWGHQIWE